MNQSFTPEQSREIDDRIVEMIVAVHGEGPLARRCRIIANERSLEIDGMDREEAPLDTAIGAAVGIASAGSWQPASEVPEVGRWVLTCCPGEHELRGWRSAPWIVACIDCEARWSDEDGYSVSPTHWMLPSAPTDLPPLPPEDSGLRLTDRS